MCQCNSQLVRESFSLLHFSNFAMIARIEMKLGMYPYYIISMTITCFHDDRVLFEKASGNFL